MPKMVFIRPLEETLIRLVNQNTPSHWEVISRQDSSNWMADLAEAEIMVGWDSQVCPQILENNHSLRWIQTWEAGVDKMPFDGLAKRGIILTNTSGVHFKPISETVLAMMLAFTRKLTVAMHNQPERKWEFLASIPEMHGKTVCIVGVGSIGRGIAKLCKAFEMKVVGVRRSGVPCEHVDHMYSTDRLIEALKDADYVVVTIPLTTETYHMFGQKEFAAMKRNTFFVNIGRGPTVDTEDLVQALSDHVIAGAGLDVFEQEPLPQESPLWGMDNVIVSPHRSGSTEYYDRRAMDIFLSNLRDYLDGKEPSTNRIQLDRCY